MKKTIKKAIEEKVKAETIELCVKECEDSKNEWEDSLEWNFFDDLITTIKALDK